MSRSSAPVLPLTLLGLALAGAGALLWWSGGEAPDATATSASPTAAGPGVAAAAAPAAREEVELVLPEPKVRFGDSHAKTATTVLWPVRVELELVEAAYLPRDPDTPRIGSGASARLRGRVGGADGGFVRAEVEFEAGPNAGRVLHSDELGRFGANDLYPGLNVVRVRSSDGGTSRRELRTRAGTETQLNLGFGRLSRLLAKVQDRRGEPIEGALVDLDGQVARSGPNGLVEFSGVTSGHVLVEVEADGYAAHKELVGVTSDSYVGYDQETKEPRLRFTLEETGGVEVVVQPDIGAGPVELFVLPAATPRRGGGASIASNAGFPWYRLNPIRGRVGAPIRIDGLPPEAVRVLAFRAGARAPQRIVSVQPGHTSQLEIPLEVAPKVTGRVLQGGEPVAGARVRLEAPNRVRATLAYFNESSAFLESAVLPDLPAAAQELETGPDGRFSLTAWSDLSSTRYLEAVGPDGRTWAGRLVREGEGNVDLALRPFEGARAALELTFGNRFQGLPVEIFVDGRPQDPITLAPDEPLLVEDLREGLWRLRIDWHGEELHVDDQLDLDGGRYARELELPWGAIHGQDEEAWVRAGRVYPL